MAELILSSKDFKALSSESRVEIIKLLGKRNYNPSELASKLGISAPTVKEHLDVLQSCDLVELLDNAHKWKYFTLSRKGKKLVAQENNNVMIVLASSIVALFSFLYWGASFFVSNAAPAAMRSADNVLTSAGAPETVGAGAQKAAESIASLPPAYDAWLALLLFVVTAFIAVYFYWQIRKASFDV
ncbi:MAG: winged helix-turn-helix domain-containing protein [Candidatus Diapherotrites archaeon]